MPIDLTEAFWLHEQCTFSMAEISELSGLSEQELREMIDDGTLVPVNPESSQWLFGADRLTTIRTACRLGKDFELDSQSLALAVCLLERIHALEAEVMELRAKLPREIT